MRLIDADKIEFLLPRTYTEEEKKTFNLVIKKAFENAPTVEAIPIEWLKEWGYKHFANYYHNISFETVIDGAINDYRKWWREEQNDE